MADLGNWMQYLGQSSVADPNTPDAQAFLQSIREYDPQAKFVSNATASNPNAGYVLQYDISKLPTNVLGKAGTFGIYDTHSAGEDIKDPNLTYQDAIYGNVTPSTNVANTKPGWLEIVGPAAVGLIAGAGATGLLDSFFFPGAAEAAAGGVGAAGAGESILGGLGPGGGMGLGGAELAAPGIEAYFPGGALSGAAAQFGGSGLLSGIGDAAKTVGNSLSTLAKSGLLGDGGGAPAVGGGGGGLLGRGGGAPVVPGAPTEAELLAAMMRRKGLSQYLNFGGNNG